MARGDTLSLTIDATHRSLEDRLDGALSVSAGGGQPRDTYARTDTFLAATSRHLAAVDAVLLPLVERHVPDGGPLVHEYLDEARNLETSLASLKARLYGEAHAVRLPWNQLWSEVRRELLQHNAMERTLVAKLVSHLEAERLSEVAQEVFRSEVAAPTRPHPFTPHTGMAGRLARLMWAKADRFWDAAEGRVIPEPVHPAPHHNDSLIAQYMTGDPHFDAGATVLDHSKRQLPKQR